MKNGKEIAEDGKEIDSMGESDGKSGYVLILSVFLKFYFILEHC